jgi:hypothetical protein
MPNHAAKQVAEEQGTPTVAKDDLAPNDAGLRPEHGAIALDFEGLGPGTRAFRS